MKKLKPILLVVLIFVAGFAAGVVTTRIAVRRFVQRAIMQPELMRDKIERDLTRKLRLDAAQREKVAQILTDAQTRLRGLRREFQPQFAGVVREAADQIRTELTPEQRERFEKFRTENAALFQPK